jgi:hypothetical protein
LDLAENCVSSSEAPASLAEDPHWNCEQADEDVQSTNGAEDLKRALTRDPASMRSQLANTRICIRRLTADEVVHAKAVEIPQVERGKCFWRFVSMAFGDVSVNADVQE